MKAIIDKSTKTITFVDADVEFVLEVLNNGKWLDAYEFVSDKEEVGPSLDWQDGSTPPPRFTYNGVEQDETEIVLMETDKGTFVGYYDYPTGTWVDNDFYFYETVTDFVVYRWKYLEL